MAGDTGFLVYSSVMGLVLQDGLDGSLISTTKQKQLIMQHITFEGQETFPFELGTKRDFHIMIFILFWNRKNV